MRGCLTEPGVPLNVPFDGAQYEPLYVALVAGVTAFGGTPRAVRALPPQRDRLRRLRSIISECDASIHDLSRVETSGQPARATVQHAL